MSNFKLDLVLLQNTKREVMGDRLVRSSVGSVMSEWCALPTIGTLSGILLAWNPSVNRRKDVRMSVFSIFLLLEDISLRVEWLLAGVYRPFVAKHQSELWEKLGVIWSSWGVFGCAVGKRFQRFLRSTSKIDAHLAFGLLAVADDGGCSPAQKAPDWTANKSQLARSESKRTEAASERPAITNIHPSCEAASPLLLLIQPLPLEQAGYGEVIQMNTFLSHLQKKLQTIYPFVLSACSKQLYFDQASYNKVISNHTLTHEHLTPTSVFTQIYRFIEFSSIPKIRREAQACTWIGCHGDNSGFDRDEAQISHLIL